MIPYRKLQGLMELMVPLRYNPAECSFVVLAAQVSQAPNT